MNNQVFFFPFFTSNEISKALQFPLKVSTQNDGNAVKFRVRLPTLHFGLCIDRSSIWQKFTNFPFRTVELVKRKLPYVLDVLCLELILSV
jgi:hypothetical protein